VSTRKIKKKNRKHGRNAQFCTFYRNSGRRDRNKLVKLLRRLRHHPNDLVAVQAAERIRHG
jgi:hypothetical protein